MKTLYIQKLSIIILVLFISILFEFIYLKKHSFNNTKIQTFCQISKSYNLALSNETIAIRDRYESSIFDIFGISPTSREYFTSTFAYQPFLQKYK